MRVIGLDWGTVRIGIAMSDEDQKLAFPLQHTLEASTAIDDIQHMIEEYGVDKVIMGMPVSLKGEDTGSTEKAKKFAQKLQERIKMDVEFIDERFSSVASTHALHEQGVKEEEQRHIKDNIAAALMLQQYLDTKNK
jgi:putative holliday junction resolvase